MQKKQYQTAGRQALAEYLAAHPDRQFTVEEICLAVNGDGEKGRSSIYRRLDELCCSGEVCRARDGDTRSYVYRYIGKHCDCSSHFHEKCTRCGAIRHLECGDSDDFVAHLLQVHGFAVDRGQSVLYGVCESCRLAEGGRI